MVDPNQSQPRVPQEGQAEKSPTTLSESLTSTLSCVEIKAGSCGLVSPVGQEADEAKQIVSDNEAHEVPAPSVSPSLSGTPLREEDALATDEPSSPGMKLPSPAISGSPRTTRSVVKAEAPKIKKERSVAKKRNSTRTSGGLPSAESTKTMGSSTFPKPCIEHKPSIEELQSYSFSDYIRDVVLTSAMPKFEDTDENDIDDEDWSSKVMPLTEGIGKVSLPDGFWDEAGIAKDRTARGPAWQKGQPLGDYILESPIAQHVRGMAGVYEYTFTDNPAMSIADFREKADQYREHQVGTPFDEDEVENATDEDKDDDKDKKESAEKKNLPADSDERMIQLDRHFWKRLGPTMPPSWYGADQEGTLFGEDPASGWSVAQLDSCLHVLSRVPGVTTPYLYAGMWASTFCAHTEDMNLLSINYLHAGAPKLWYAVAPGPDAKRFEALCEFHYSIAARSCKEFMRHKRYLLSPMILHKAGIKYTTTIQRPGDAIITFPGGYHFGFNTGFNIAEATNFGVPEWIPYGLQAKVCLCRPDSVRIDMQRLMSLLDMFESDRGRNSRLTWKQWAQRREKKKNRYKKNKTEETETDAVSSGSRSMVGGRSMAPTTKGGSKAQKRSEQERKNEFWVEVMKPAPRVSIPKAKKPTVEEEEEVGRGKRKRKKTDRMAAFEAESEKKTEVAAPIIIHEEMWHLAKPIGRKGVEARTRVLCLLPGAVMRSTNDNVVEMLEEEDEDEQCFAGNIVEVTDDHARIRLEGLPKTEDVWLPLWHDKIFLDGGKWTEDRDFKMPKLHYWKEMDSKRRRSED